MLEDALMERMEWGLGSVVRSGSQFDSVSQVPSTHGKECVWIRVVQHELHVFGSSFVVVGITNRSGDAKSPIGTVLHKWWSGVSVAWELIDQVLVGAIDENRWRW